MTAPSVMPTASKRRRKTRTKQINPHPPIVASELALNQIDLHPGKEHLVCPSCGTWCPITGMEGTPKLVPHHTRRAGASKPRRCLTGTNRRVDLKDLNIEAWARDAAEGDVTAATRRTNRVNRKPRAPLAPPVTRMEPVPPTAEAVRERCAEHLRRCSACAGRFQCATGKHLASEYARLLPFASRHRRNRELLDEIREEAERGQRRQSSRRQAAVWTRHRVPSSEGAATAKRSGTSIEEANNQRGLGRPGSVSDYRGPDVPLAPVRIASGPVEAPGTLWCSCCRTTVAAGKAGGWKKVTGTVHCPKCAAKVPEWMRRDL